MRNLCTIEDVKAFLLADYVTAAEAINGTIIGDTISKVSGEIIDLLSYRYNIASAAGIPVLVQNIASVFSAYRIVEAITGIVSTEAGVDNVWIPLQKEYQRMDNILKELAKGTLKLPLEELKPDREDPSVAIVSPPSELDLKGY